MSSALLPLKNFWQKLQPRERTGLGVAATLLLVYAVWALWLLPAWRVLDNAPAQHRALDESLARMVQMQSQVQALRSQNKVSTTDAAQARIERSLSKLGDGAKLEAQGDQIVVTLKNIAPTQLAAWLNDLQQQQLAVQSGQIQAAGAEPLWSGRLNFKGAP